MSGNGKKSKNQIKHAVNRILFQNHHESAQNCDERKKIKYVDGHNYMLLHFIMSKLFMFLEFNYFFCFAFRHINSLSRIHRLNQFLCSINKFSVFNICRNNSVGKENS